MYGSHTYYSGQLSIGANKEIPQLLPWSMTKINSHRGHPEFFILRSKMTGNGETFWLQLKSFCRWWSRFTIMTILEWNLEEEMGVFDCCGNAIC